MNEGGKIILKPLGRNAMLKTHKIRTDLWFCVNLLEIFFFTFIIIINNTSYFQTILHLKVFQIIEPPSHRMITAGGAQSAVLLKVGKYHSILALRWRGM